MEDEFENLKPKPAPPQEMERWNVEDLKAYRTRLTGEIGRIDAVLAGKDSVRGAADELFKKGK